MDANKNTQHDDTADAFIHVERVVQFSGEAITVPVIDVLQAIKISRALKQVLPALDRVQTLLAREDSDLSAPGAVEIAMAVELLADYGEPLTEGIAIAIGKPVAFVQSTKDLGGLIELIFALVSVNGSFFSRAVAPRLAALQSEALPAGPGQTPSTTSSVPATH